MADKTRKALVALRADKKISASYMKEEAINLIGTDRRFDNTAFLRTLQSVNPDRGAVGRVIVAAIKRIDRMDKVAEKRYERRTR